MCCLSSCHATPCPCLQSAARTAAQEQLLRHSSSKLPQTRLGFFWYWISRWIGSCWFEFRWHVRQVVERPAFGQFFLAAIVANTVLLAMTTAGQYCMPCAGGACQLAMAILHESMSCST
jgi:hypothetical protein